MGSTLTNNDTPTLANNEFTNQPSTYDTPTLTNNDTPTLANNEFTNQPSTYDTPTLANNDTPNLPNNEFTNQPSTYDTPTIANNEYTSANIAPIPGKIELKFEEIARTLEVTDIDVENRNIELVDEQKREIENSSEVEDVLLSMAVIVIISIILI